MNIANNNDFVTLVDNPVHMRCPTCGTLAAMIPIAIPRYELVHRFSVQETGMVCHCGACKRAVFFRYQVSSRSNPIVLSDSYEIVGGALEPFEMQYLKTPVLDDFKEALTCYANSAWNAFGAMCRRCLQSVASTLGAEGTTKVQAQLNDLQAMGVADAETFKVLKAIMLAGHDGAHPHLPALSQARAAVLMQLMKDVLYQLFVRPEKIREAAALRADAAKKH